MLNRRDILNLGVAAASGSASLFASTQARSQEIEPTPFRVVDTNINLFRWPFRRLPLDESAVLLQKLRSLGIAQGWAGSFEGVLHRDVAGVNRRLAEACRGRTQLIPIGTVNPELPDWEEDLRRCVDQHEMPGIRLHPNYHGYTLTDPRFTELLELATAAGRFVQVVAAIEDTRTQHPLVRVADVDLAPLADVLPRIPGARVQILNFRPRPPLIDTLAKTPGLFFDVARVEATDGVPDLIRRLPPGRVMFGTHAPFLVPEAALIRVHESGQLEEAALRDVLSENAERLLGNVNA